MKVLVLGAGVVGVTSAWYLAQAGHEVMVADRRPHAGMETSFANGGQISAAHAQPWAQPSALVMLSVLADSIASRSEQAAGLALYSSAVVVGAMVAAPAAAGPIAITAPAARAAFR